MLPLVTTQQDFFIYLFTSIPRAVRSLTLKKQFTLAVFIADLCDLLPTGFNQQAGLPSNMRLFTQKQTVNLL